ncbi:MAG: M1 family metallopeptidase [Bacteroidota bacterium]
MWKLIILLATLIGPFFLIAQSAPYFQQQADYHIQAELDTSLHQLTVSAQLTYTNNSPDTLRQLAFHLWMNAYAKGNTALADQENYHGQPRQYFAPEDQRGGYDSLQFLSQEKILNSTHNAQQPEIVFVSLSEPLPPSTSRIIDIDYQLQLPPLTSRAGYADDYYLVAQWYPKPAVYDREGWHTMPYLENGEYYAEFGNYEVSMTVPGDFVVASTGELKTEEELAWVDAITNWSKKVDAINGDDFPAKPRSIKNPTKTIHFTAQNIHDFTWVASPNFLVQKDTVALTPEQTVTAWAFFTLDAAKEWADINTYTRQSLVLFSELVGTYPYPQYSCVLNPNGYGGGMEYAMLTVLDNLYTKKYVEMVTAHEVAHSWYQHILGFNERNHAWLDEGLTSYLEYRYSQQYHGTGPDCWCDFGGESELISDARNSYIHLARRGLLAPGNSSVHQQTQAEYGTMAYDMPLLGFRLLAEYYGEDRWDDWMRDFYEEWKFKHPSPADVQLHLEAFFQDDLDWYFEDYIAQAGTIDYGIQKMADNKVHIKNHGSVAVPFVLAGYSLGGEEQFRQWVSGFVDAQAVLVPDLGNSVSVVVDPDRYLPDTRRVNNRRRTSMLAAKNIWPRLSMRPAETFDDWRATTFLFPGMIGNEYDGFIPGLAITSDIEQQERFEYKGFLGYALKSKSPAGGFATRYHLWQGARGERFSLGLGGKQFHFFEQQQFDYQLQFRRLVPSLQYLFQRPLGSSIRQDLQLRLIWLSQEQAQFSSTGDYLGNTFQERYIPHLRYRLKNDKGLHPFDVEATLEFQSYEDVFGDQQSYLRSTLAWTQDWTYAIDRRVQFRLFVGSMLFNTARNRGSLSPGYFSLVGQGQNDYRFDGSFFGRQETSGVFANQIVAREGGFKAPIPSSFQVGRSNSFIISTNVKAQLPAKLPFQLFLDLGYYDNATPIGEGATFADQFLWSAGFAFELADGTFGLYVPLLNSDDVNGFLSERGNFFERISFQVDLMRLSPWRYRDWGERLE